MDKATFVKKLLAAMVDSVRAAKEIPSGHLYAVAMQYGVSLEAYYDLEKMMLKYFKVKKQGHVLSWTDEAEAFLNAGATA